MKAAVTGSGKYDAEVRAVMAGSAATVVLLVVVGGNRGHGFSVAVNDASLSAEQALTEVPSLLRAIADGIDEDQRQGRN